MPKRRSVIRITRFAGFLTALLLASNLVTALPAHAATTNYGPKSGSISSDSATKKPRYLSYPFPVSGASTIDATLSWPTSAGADLNIIIKDPSNHQQAATTTASANPEHLVFTTPASASGNWKVFAFARKGTVSTFTLNWSVTTGPPPNQAPHAVADSFATAAGTASNFAVLTNDTDADGPTPLTVGTVGTAAHGTVTNNGGDVTYTPSDSAFNGYDSFTYTACDGSNLCSTPATVTVTVGTPPPVANNDTATATTAVAKTIDVLGNDTGSGTLSVGDVSVPGHGTVTNNGSNVTYTSAASYTGADSFTYTACVASVCSAAATVNVTVQAPVAPGSNYLKVFSPQNIGSKNSFTTDEAKAVAGNFDVIVATPAAFKGDVPAMHDANSNVKVLAYVNSAFVGSSQGPATNQFPSSWYMRDANGNPVQSKYNNYMMDIGNPDWVNNRKTTCKNTAAASGYDGCSLDMLGTAPLDPGYTKTMPVKSTGGAWTPAEYYDASSALAKAVQDYAAPMLVDGNGLRAGNQYFNTAGASSKKLFIGTREAMAEAFVRAGPAACGSYRAESAWKQDVDMLVDAGRAGHGAMTLTKAWCDGTPAVKDALHEYTLATFLLGTDGHSYFFFSYADGTDATAMHPFWKTNIGTPAGAYPNYAKVGNVYIRTFTGGIVIANPTTAAGSITLPAGSYKDINTGATYSGTVSVPVHAGWVLVNN